MTTPDEPRTTVEHGDAGLADAIVQLSFVVQAVLARAADEHGLSTTQARMLVVLSDREIGMLQLARILELEKSSVTGLVDRAERRGLVQRTPVPGNRRAVTVVLTPIARDLVRAFRQAVHDQLAGLTGSLDAGARDALHRSVDSLVQSYADRQGVPF